MGRGDERRKMKGMDWSFVTWGHTSHLFDGGMTRQRYSRKDRHYRVVPCQLLSLYTATWGIGIRHLLDRNLTSSSSAVGRRRSSRSKSEVFNGPTDLNKSRSPRRSKRMLGYIVDEEEW